MIPVCLWSWAAAPTPAATTQDVPFAQETARKLRVAPSPAANDVRAIALAPTGEVWVATRAGLFALKPGEATWRAAMPESEAGPALSVACDGHGGVWAGAWNGLYRGEPDGTLARVTGIDAPVALVTIVPGGVRAMGPDGSWSVKGDRVERLSLSTATSFRSATVDRDGSLWVATEVGLYQLTERGAHLLRGGREVVSSSVRAVATAPDGAVWAGCLGGISVLRDGKRAGTITPKQGLPCSSVTALAFGPQGEMWVGTPIGAARYGGKTWSLRHGLRWLPSDEVRGIAVAPDGAAWVATSDGVSVISRAPMTLAEKARRFLEVCYARHIREPGLVEKVALDPPGDLASWKPRDDDNDGQYTAMYLAMESYRYAVTRDPVAQEAARRAFRALKFLQTVTGTPGFVARTVVPANWTGMADPNEVREPQQVADERARDPRSKYVPVRWRPSADGEWLWKGDTSSDEITGHYYGYTSFYDLAANEEDKVEVREHVRRVTDGIIGNGLTLVDIDGRHTRWAVWAPERLTGDGNWRPESGINAVEILSYLKTAHHMTGDPRYDRLYQELYHKRGYAKLVDQAKTVDPAWRTHIDDELLALALPALLRHEADPAKLQRYRRVTRTWYRSVDRDGCPLFDYTLAMATGSPPDTHDSLRFLREAPMDLVRWRMDNSRREDIALVRSPEPEVLQTSRLLSPAETCVMRWDNHPFEVVQGDGGATESDGVFWLLPYWMGRYMGLIGEAASGG
jgi:hypothetical protein